MDRKQKVISAYLAIAALTLALTLLTGGSVVSVVIGMLLSGVLVYTVYRLDVPHYRQQAAVSPQATFSINRRGQIQSWNPACERTFRHGQEIIGKSYTMLLVDEHEQRRLAALIARVFDHQEAFNNVDAHYRYGVDSQLVMMAQLNPVMDERGRVVECMVTNSPAVDNSKMVEALRASEERFQQIALNIKEVFYIIDLREHKLVYASPAYETIWERPLEEWKSDADAFMKAVHPDDVEAVWMDMAHGTGADLEFRLLVSGREVRWVRMRNTYLRNHNDAIHTIIGIAEDITARKRAETALREAEEQYRTLTESTHDALLLMQDGECIFTNQAFKQRFGSCQGNFLDYFVPQDREPISALYLDDPAADSPQHVEARLMDPDDPQTTMEVTAHQIDYQGRAAVMIVLRDITERKHAAELELERLRMQILTDFVHDASHEFRTPLSIINTKLYLLQRAPDRLDEIATGIGEQVTSINQLVDSLVLMSQLDSRAAFKQQTIQPETMLRYVVERMEDRASVHQLTLAINTDSALPTLTGDDDLLEKAFTHLVDNAIRYTPAHGRVTLHARAAESELVVEIEDSGIGIAQADLPHIFERFHRADDAHSTRGFGLGLPIVQKIVEGHGGRITVESEPGVGTTFRVFLPIMSVPVME